MRIIAGTARGRNLLTPANITRPTSDRAREGIFSSLTSELGTWDGVAFLDLFAGTGAVGLEALSRGAQGPLGSGELSPTASRQPQADSTGLSAAPRQRTLSRPVTVRGKGLMLGADATVTIQPAPPHSGVAFVRTDLNPPVRIPATADHVAPRPRRTACETRRPKITRGRIKGFAPPNPTP